MAYILGIPAIKGNSQEIVSCRYDPASYNNGQPASGLAQAYTVGGIEPEIVPTQSGRFIGFTVQVNACASTATVIRAGLAVPVRAADDFPPSVGDQVWVEKSSGFVVAPNTPDSNPVNGTIEKVGITALSSVTGDLAIACLINFGSGRTTNATI